MGVAGANVKNHFQSKKCLPELFSTYKKAKNQHPSMILKSDQIWSALMCMASANVFYYSVHAVGVARAHTDLTLYSAVPNRSPLYVFFSQNITT